MPDELFERFILRHQPKADIPTLRPGDTCLGGAYIKELPQDSKRLVQVFPDRRKWAAVWVSRSLLLPVSQYLKCSPSGKFWAIARQASVFRNAYYPYLSRPSLPSDRRFGRTPWRFESLGEAVYCARRIRLDPNEYLISEMTMLKYLL